MPAVGTFNQQAYRFYNDDGSETTNTASVAQNTSNTVHASVDLNICLRLRIAETSGLGSGAATDDFKIQYRNNGGTWTDVTTSSSVIKAFNSTNLTDGGATTNRLTGGTGSFLAGKISEDGQVDDVQITANNYTELLYTLTYVSADLSNGDVLEFRVLINGTTIVYDVTPTTNITKDVVTGIRILVAASGNLIF